MLLALVFVRIQLFKIQGGVMMGKGDYSHKFDASKLEELIKQGKNAKEIMQKLDISRWTLKEHLLILQNRNKKYYEIPGLFDDAVIFSAKMLEKTGFQAGDEFEMIVEKDRIILKKI
jgi:hypothetical protein